MNIPCPYCEDGTIFTSRYGGNDPDVWAKPCLNCDATGTIIQYCEAYKCTSEADTIYDGSFLCAWHLAEFQDYDAPLPNEPLSNA